MVAVCFVFAFLIPYFICGINSAIIVTKIKSGVDIRTLGSGNAGLTNTLRTQGKTAALFVLLGDLLKGALSIILVRLAFYLLAGIATDDLSNGYNFVAYLAAVTACLGHIFPPYYGFKGGKGVLVTAAVLLTVDWLPAVILLSIFAVIVSVTKYVSLGSVIAGSLYPVAVLIVSIVHNDPAYILNFIYALFIAFLLVFMHRENIKRLKAHTEKKLGQKE